MHNPAGRTAVPEVVATDAEEDRSQRVMQTYMVGTFLAVNAIRDAYALVEGPDCIHMKTQYVQGNHDWLSTLTSVSGVHRIANTALHPVHMSASREREVRDFLARMGAHEAVKALLLTSMPMAFITGVDYEGICRDVALASGKPVVHVKGNSLSRDWLDGYAEVLLSCARQLPFGAATPDHPIDPSKVAIVGNMFDRNEGDHRGNVRELRRIVSGLGLDPVSIWLDGGPFEDILRAREAGLVVSLPYGRKAARLLAKRTGAKLVECELPFGLGATERFVRALGAAAGRDAEAEAFIDSELSEVVPSLEFVVPFVFQNRRWGFVGDPHLARGVKDIAELLGSKLVFAVITDADYHCTELDPAFRAGMALEIYPRQRRYGQVLGQAVSSHGVHVIVTNTSGGFLPMDAAVVELGFPSPYTHCLYDRPFLGFRGFLAFVDTVANAMRQFEVRVEQERRMGGSRKPDAKGEPA